jgi:hypothetical protein
VLAGQHDEWVEGRRYLSLDALARARVRLAEQPPAPSTESGPAALEAAAA